MADQQKNIFRWKLKKKKKKNAFSFFSGHSYTLVSKKERKKEREKKTYKSRGSWRTKAK